MSKNEVLPIVVLNVTFGLPLKEENILIKNKEEGKRGGMYKRKEKSKIDEKCQQCAIKVWLENRVKGRKRSKGQENKRKNC